MTHTPTAIITGAGRGIGRATAIALAQQGYRLMLCSRTEAELQAVSQACEGSSTLIADVSRVEDCQRLVARTRQVLGRIDALVHAAGIAPLKPIEHTTDEDWRKTIDTNLSATFYLCRACWPVFREQSGGVIVNVSSMSARDPFPGFSAYAPAKAGINALGIVLSKEGAPINVRVHTVAPGATETIMFRSLPGMSNYPSAKVLDPDEVARVIVGCVTGELASTSGEVIYLHKDG